MTLVPWRREYDLHTTGFPDHSIDDAANRDILAGMIETNGLWVLDEAGCSVSMTGFNAALPDVVQVGGVFTPVEWRGRGDGRALWWPVHCLTPWRTVSWKRSCSARRRIIRAKGL